LVRAIALAKSDQPVLATGDHSDPDAPDEEAGVVIQVAIPGIEAAAPTPLVVTETETRTHTGMPDDDGPIWPDEVAESGMRVEIAGRRETLNSKAAREAAEAAAEAAAEKKNLPPLDDLINQIPCDVRDTLEDLLRVKFMKVARSPKNSLKL
jgi:hypothetical protein